MRPPRHAMFVAEVMVAATTLFTLIRILLLVRNYEMIGTGADSSLVWVLRALGTGIRFDLALIFDIMLPVVAALIIAQCWHRASRWMVYIALWWLSLSLSLTLMAMIGDIPYFEHFQAHINALGMHYATADVQQLLHMIIDDGIYLIFALLSLVVAFGATLFILYRAQHHKLGVPSPHRRATLLWLLIFALLFPLADRGFHFRHQTLKARDALISDNTFINKLSINAVPTFIESLQESSGDSRVMDTEAAALLVRHELHRGEEFTEHIAAKPSPWRNVIFIIEESLSSSRLIREGAEVALMPHLEKLITEGRYYENCYSAGAHTAYGIYALVTSLMPYVDRHPLEENIERPIGTIFDQLYSRGELSTLFFVTHGPNYDNVRGFSLTQGFGHLYSRHTYNYPTDNVWGVDDHVMFDRALEHIDGEWMAGRNVAALCLTCSNHHPFEIPLDAGFTPTSEDSEERAVEYADWALHRFMTMAAEREWFSSTLFVITGDHGRVLTTDYAIPESLNHVPLLFYSPGNITPEVRSDLVAQMDITPTAMSMLGKEFDNDTMGIDLNTSTREIIPYTSDGYIAARNHEWLYIYDMTTEQPMLYDLTSETKEADLAAEYPERVYDMHNYVSAMMQASWDKHNAIGAWSIPTAEN